MNIKKYVTNYFEENNLFEDKSISDGLKIENSNNTLLIEGDTRDLVMLADLLVNVALDKTKGAHIHIDKISLLSDKSNVKEVIIEKLMNN